MKTKVFIFGILILFIGLVPSVAIACNCGKGINSGNQISSCQRQCGGSCGGQSCSDTAVSIPQSKVDQKINASEVNKIEVGNKICPITKNKVGKMGPPIKFEYNGKVYNLCCPMCKKSFNKNPKKYSTIAEDEVASIKNIF